MTYAQAIAAIKTAMTAAKGNIMTAQDAILQVSDGAEHLTEINQMLNQFNTMAQAAIKFEAMPVPASNP